MTPPQQLDALWAFARAATSKSATPKQQSEAVKAYMPKVIAAYQGGTVCDALTQAELNELLQLAASSPDRPASYKLASAADLDAARKDMTIASVVTDLKAGGDKAKLTWTGGLWPGISRCAREDHRCRRGTGPSRVEDRLCDQRCGV